MATAPFPPPPSGAELTSGDTKYVSQPWADWFYRLASLLAEADPESDFSQSSSQAFMGKEFPSPLLYNPVESQAIQLAQTFGGRNEASPRLYNQIEDQGILASQIFGG
jgi:hypothetical protein